MSKDLKFICNVSDYKAVEDAVHELNQFFEKADQEQTFLKARLKQLEQERGQRWEVLWKALYESSALPASISTKGHKLILGDQGKQIFTDTHQQGGGLLERLLGVDND